MENRGDDDKLAEEVIDDDEMDQYTSSTPPRKSSSLRSDSMLSPPPPPPKFFNPPADTPNSPSDTVSPPSTGPPSASASSTSISQLFPAMSSSGSISQQLDSDSHQISIAAAAAAAGGPRPQLRAFQRVSQDSIGSPASVESAGSTISGGSTEGGEHLAEAREILLHSGETSRRESLTTDRGEMDERRRDSFELNIINPTPPLHPADMMDESEQPEAGPSRPRRSITPPATTQEGHDLPAEHAWDSVWPAPGSMPRNPFIADATRSHFPTAPVSPFVTPAFSPAIIPTTAIPRRPPSPSSRISDPTSPTKRSNSPASRAVARDNRGSRSPTIPYNSSEDILSSRRNSITSSMPFSAQSPPSTSSYIMNKHQRSFSASTPAQTQKSLHKDAMDRLQGSPPISPPSPPDTRPSPAKTPLTDEAHSARRPQPTSTLKGSDRLADLSSPVPPPISLSNLSGSGLSPSSVSNSSFKLRPRGRSMSAAIRPSPTGLPLESGPPCPDSPRPHPPQSPANPPSSAFNAPPPISLPPSVASAPVFPPPGGDDGLPGRTDTLAFLTSHLPIAAAPTMAPPLFAPLTRPTALRRAMSDYDPAAAAKARTIPPLQRSLSVTPELDKSPKRLSNSSEGASQLSPRFGADPTNPRARKSPGKSPIALSPLQQSHAAPGAIAAVDDSEIPPLTDDFDMTQRTESEEQDDIEPQSSDHYSDIQLVDEGDVLPNIDFQMDVTFDDEGLNTLERIFLLSKSDFPFHRAYVARVLGDLLAEVDPCESVEYVLPLLSGFSMDEDESVKEAFASELHRILWYFYSTCRLVYEDEEEEIGGLEYKPMTETITVTSKGMDVVPKPEDVPIPTMPQRRGSATSAPSTASSNMTLINPEPIQAAGSEQVDTPNSSISETPSSQSTMFSPEEFVNPFADDVDPEKGWTKDVGPLVDRPALNVNFFTPLLGSLLLNQNPTISDSIRNGVVNLIGRLRHKVDPQADVWGAGVSSKEVDERRTFASQNGPHAHDLRPFDQASRSMVEEELLHGIVIGMGQLSTDMPEGLFPDHLDESADQQGPTEAELFQEQLIAEATAGRATSMNLIGSLCEYYAAEDVVANGFVDEVLRSGDGDVSVRAEGAVALSLLAKIAPVEQVYEMIPLFELFVEDPTAHVRQSVCLSLPAICKRIEASDYRREFAVKAVTALAQSGDDVRCAVLEMLGEIIYVFDDDPNGPPIELLQVYMEDTAGHEAIDGDWDVVAAFNFPGVALTIGPDRWPELRTLYSRLQIRAGDKIQRILAASLHELAKILHPPQIEADLLPVYKTCLACNDEIRERVYEHVDVLISRVSPVVGWDMFEDLARAWKDGSLGGWRAREQLALHLPKMLELFRDVEKGEKVLDVLRDALLDPFAAVRDGVTKGIPDAYAVLGDDSLVAVRFRDMLLDLGSSSIYRRRLTFVRCLREFIRPPPNQKAFENFFIPALPRLSHDVIDVRLGLAQAIADLFVVGAYYGEMAGPVPQAITQLTELLSDDEAADVRDTIHKVDTARMHKGKGVPHHVAPKTAPDRSSKPDDHPDERERAGGVGQDGQRANNIAPVGDQQRRPSAEVTDKMDSMAIEKSGESTDTEVQQGPEPTSPVGPKSDENSPRDTHFSFETPQWIGPRSSSGDMARQQAFPRRKPSDPFSASFSHAMTSASDPED